jgi:predicted ester cyclase
MSPAENKELVRRYFDERWNHGSLDVCDELLSSSMDIEEQKEFVRAQHAALGDLHLTILDLLAEDDQVAIHWRIDGTHKGDFLGVAATGKPVTFLGIALLRITDGKIADDIADWDNQSILEQLGAVPPTGQA